jgi:hypothetical protein
MNTSRSSLQAALRHTGPLQVQPRRATSALRSAPMLVACTLAALSSCSNREQVDTAGIDSAEVSLPLSVDNKRGRRAPEEEMLAVVQTSPELIGREVSTPSHFSNGDEFVVSTQRLLDHGRDLFIARWTSEEGQGRPFGKGNDGELTDPTSPLTFPHNFNRISGPAGGSCSGCHNQPRIGGGGDIAGSVFVLGNRFDFLTFDPNDTTPIRGRLDERGIPATFQSASNPRKTTGMFGSGYIEMLARQMTAELQALAAACTVGHTCALSAKSVDFGSLTHNADGTWNTHDVTGLPPKSTKSDGTTAPSFIVQPFFQSGAVISLREFSLNSFSRLHGVQAEERFGAGEDQDADGYPNELSIADVTAISVYQATLPVPGQVIPRQAHIERAIVKGEALFEQVGCSSCHVRSLSLDSVGTRFTEPGPYNPTTTLQLPDVERVYGLDLNDESLPQPRLRDKHGVTEVPAYTDLKLHDITSGLPSCSANLELEPLVECDPDVEAISQHYPNSDPRFFEGNALFLTRRLWGIANQHAFGHHGQYTTLREAIEAHRGEANAVRTNYDNLDANEQGAIIEFLKSLQVLPADTRCTIVDEQGNCRAKPRR